MCILMPVRKTDYSVLWSSHVLKHPDVHVQTTKIKIAAKQNHLLPPLKSPNLLHHWQLWNTFLVLRRRVSFGGPEFGLELQSLTKGWQSSKGLEEAQGRFSIVYVWNQISLSHTNKKNKLQTNNTKYNNDAVLIKIPSVLSTKALK